ncbi:MAG: efflux RND transporter periplasmic adaptor subunit [Rhodospirillales bacterium]
MRRVVLVPAVVAVLAVAATAAYVFDNGQEGSTQYRTARVEQGTIVSAVSTTGTLNAVTTVLVGSQLSGQIKELMADFNSEVKAGQVIARLDQDQIKARLAQAQADREASKAQVMQQKAAAERAKADVENSRAAIANMRAQAVRADVALKDAERDDKRKQELLPKGVVTQADADKTRAARDTAKANLAAAQAQLASAEAQLAASQALARVAEAQIDNAVATVAQREAAVQQVKVDLERSEIRSPIDGVVVQRAVDVGQTVAASLQAPTIFTIAEDLRRMEVYASVDEADIGRVRVGQPVAFTVTAHPGDTFRGEVKQIRLAPQTVSNVGTYVVVLAADNQQRKLLPGMTATARIVADSRDGAIKRPNAALRWRPAGAQAEGAPQGAGGVLGVAGTTGGGQQGGRGWANLDTMLKTLTEELKLSPEQQKQIGAIVEEGKSQFAELGKSSLEPDARRARAVALRRNIGQRVAQALTDEQRPRFRELQQARTAASTAGQVWVLGPGGKPEAIAVRLGIGDGAFTEMVGGPLKPGQELLIGGGPKTPAASAAAPGGLRLGF